MIRAADMYEVAVLLGACFLVNYVTADSKTNWAEGYIMVAFYFMIVSSALRIIIRIFRRSLPYLRG